MQHFLVMFVNYANDQVYFDGPNSKKSANFGCVCAQSLHFHKITETFLLLQRATKKKKICVPAVQFVHDPMNAQTQLYTVPAVNGPSSTPFQSYSVLRFSAEQLEYCVTTKWDSLLLLFTKDRP